MASIRHLAKAPIGEALLDIRTQPNVGLVVDELIKIAPLLGPNYGQRQEKKQGHFQLNLGATGGPTNANAQLTSTTMGFEFRNTLNNRLVQIAREGFTQNFLPPYTSGDELLAESRKNWQHYVEIASPVNATRLALRYINRLRLPGDMVDFDDFLTVAPQIPKDLPQILANFFGKVVIVNEKIGAFGGVSQTFTGEVDETGVEIVLDIDVFTEGAYEVAADSIWDKFVQLRQFKNEIFFGFVTDKLLEAYQ